MTKSFDLELRNENLIGSTDSHKAKLREAFQKALVDLDAIFELNKHELLFGSTAQEVCAPLVDRFAKSMQFDLVELWSVDPRRECLILVARATFGHPIRTTVVSPLPVADSMTGEAVETRLPVMFNRNEIRHGVGKRRFVNRELLDEIQPRSMFCIPVLNIGNPHQVLFVFNFFTRLRTSEALNQEDLLRLSRPAERLAVILESDLRERTVRVSNDLARALAKSKSKLTTESAYKTLAETVLRRLKADRVCVYLYSQNKLKRQVSVGSSHATPVDHFTLQVHEAFRSNRESIEARIEDGKRLSSLVVPLLDVRGNCGGVVECVVAESSCDGAWKRTHTYDDVALIEAMAQTFAPTLETLSADERRDESLSTLAHELRVPVTAFRAVCERLERECVSNDFQFNHRYFSELKTYTEIMQRLMKKLTIVRTGIVDVQRKYVSLLSDIVNPTVRFMRPVLTKHRFQKSQLKHSGFDQIPRVSLDTALITQVLFNAIENAIKYFPKDRPKIDFECNVRGFFSNDTLFIDFEDNGCGIADSDRDRIFEYGERGPEEETCGIEGTGFGLYYCREIARSHGGAFYLLKPRDRTIFRLMVPCPRFR